MLVEGGVAIIPAFSIRMSRREVWEVIRRAHSWTDFRDDMSHLKKVRFALGVVARMEDMSLVALCSLRPLKKMCAGSCFARAAMEPAPRPAVPVGTVSGRLGLIELRWYLPPVMKTTLPAKFGMSVSGLKVLAAIASV